MSQLATIEPAAAPIAPKEKRQRLPSKAIRQAIDLLETGECKTQKAAAGRIGISEHHLSRSLKQVHVEVFIARKRAENLSRGALRASYRYAELVDAKSEHVAAQVSETILINAGDLKSGPGTNISITNNIAPGYVIDMRDPRDAKTIEAAPRPIANGTD